MSSCIIGIRKRVNEEKEKFLMRTEQKEGRNGMSGKFMRIKKMVLPTITMVMIASQLMGCAAASQSELLQMLEKGDAIEIEIAQPISEEKGEQSSFIWEKLGLLDTNSSLRNGWEDTLGITGANESKNGVLYVNVEGYQDSNNTLRVALHNREFLKFMESETALIGLANDVVRNYVDVEEGNIEQAISMGINGYFNLLPDSTENYANPYKTLSRGEFLGMVMRAETPVQEIELDTSFESLVGKSDYNIYAQEVVKDNYLDTESKSLNHLTYSGSMTRAEAVYFLMNHYFGSELKTVETKGVTFTDAKDGGDIATKQKFKVNGVGKDYWKSYELTYALQNAEKGLPSDLYKSLVLAYQKGFIGSETRWDEAITKEEAVSLLVDTLKIENGINLFSFVNGITKEGEILVDNGDVGSAGSSDSEVSEEDLSVQREEEMESNAEANAEGLSESTGVQIVEEFNKKMYVISDSYAYDIDGVNGESMIFNAGFGLDVTGLTSNDWYRVQSGGYTGYMPKEYLSEDEYYSIGSRLAREEAERQAAEQARLEAERKAEEARLQAEREAQAAQQATESEEQRLAREEAERQAAEQARLEAEEKARQEEEQARLQAEAESKAAEQIAQNQAANPDIPEDRAWANGAFENGIQRDTTDYGEQGVIVTDSNNTDAKTGMRYDPNAVWE